MWGCVCPNGIRGRSDRSLGRERQPQAAATAVGSGFRLHHPRSTTSIQQNGKNQLDIFACIITGPNGPSFEVTPASLTTPPTHRPTLTNLHGGATLDAATSDSHHHRPSNADWSRLRAMPKASLGSSWAPIKLAPALGHINPNTHDPLTGTHTTTQSARSERNVHQCPLGGRADVVPSGSQ